MNPDFINALIGGVVIGFATVLMMHFNGRVTGISSIINGTFPFIQKDWAWRILFILGLFVGGLIMNFGHPEGFIDTSNTNLPLVIAAGLLVGFGTTMGSGCTSGHGVCGISRLSLRSIVATVTFIAAGVLTVAIKRFFFN
jgi:uncharacterized membrane protein YedE/YeeE